MPLTWRPMHTAPQIVERIWLNHLTLRPDPGRGPSRPLVRPECGTPSLALVSPRWAG